LDYITLFSHLTATGELKMIQIANIILGILILEDLVGSLLLQNLRIRKRPYVIKIIKKNVNAGHIGVMVPDVNAACERFEKLGVEFVKKPDTGKNNCFFHSNYSLKFHQIFLFTSIHFFIQAK